MGHKAVVLCASAVSLAIGAVGGYFYAKHRLEEQYMELAENEIAEARDRYRRMGKYDEYATPESAAKALLGADVSDEDTQELRVFNQTVQAVNNNNKQVIEDYNNLSRAQGYIADSHDGEPEDIPVQRTSVEAGEQQMRMTRQERAFQEEVARRNHDKPYIISKDEYFENDGGYIQAQYTYYEGDGVITDSNDEPLDVYEVIVGENNLKFGHLSEDPRVVYIRNEKYECDIEVEKRDGSYGEEVQGFTPEPDKEWFRESNGSRPSRFEGRRYSGVAGGDNE